MQSVPRWVRAKWPFALKTAPVRSQVVVGRLVRLLRTQSLVGGFAAGQMARSLVVFLRPRRAGVIGQAGPHGYQQ